MTLTANLNSLLHFGGFYHFGTEVTFLVNHLIQVILGRNDILRDGYTPEDNIEQDDGDNEGDLGVEIDLLGFVHVLRGLSCVIRHVFAVVKLSEAGIVTGQVWLSDRLQLLLVLGLLIQRLGPKAEVLDVGMERHGQNQDVKVKQEPPVDQLVVRGLGKALKNSNVVFSLLEIAFNKMYLVNWVLGGILKNASTE